MRLGGRSSQGQHMVLHLADRRAAACHTEMSSALQLLLRCDRLQAVKQHCCLADLRTGAPS